MLPRKSFEMRSFNPRKLEKYCYSKNQDSYIRQEGNFIKLIQNFKEDKNDSQKILFPLDSCTYNAMHNVCKRRGSAGRGC